MKLRIASFAVLVALLGTFLVAPLSTKAAPAAQVANPLVDIPITGTIEGIGTFAGTFDVTRFAVQNGQLVAIGELSGTLTDLAGNVLGTVADFPLTLPVGAAQGATCEILDLSLGPLDLNLLGLVVHLDEINLTIDAQQSPGNLLGNLLCAVVGLLDGPGGALNGVAGLLNRILRLFG
jgi:hypothetical protein